MNFKEYCENVLSEAIGSDRKYNYAVNIKGLESNEYFKQSFGRSLNDLRKVQEFKKTAKIAYINAKGKATKSAVKEWISINKPSEYWASWQKDSKFYKDDSVEIFYK